MNSVLESAAQRLNIYTFGHGRHTAWELVQIDVLIRKQN